MPQFGVISSWSLRVLREARLVGVPARRTPVAGQRPPGADITEVFDPNNPVHLASRHKCQVDADGWSNVVPVPCEKRLTSKLSGTTVIDGFFDLWVKKNSVIGEESSMSFDYVRNYKTLDNGLGYFFTDVYAYDGEGDTTWVRDESHKLLPGFRRVCTLWADLSGLQRFLTVQKGPDDQDFWTVHYDIEVFFGGTALKAKMVWNEGVSISHFHPQGANIWLYLSGSPA